MKKILFIVNVDWFFISHRLPIALAAIKQGYEVHVACGITDKSVTSLQKELGKEMDIDQVKNKVKSHLIDLFEMKII